MKSLRYLFLENNSIHSLPSALLRNPNLTLNIANNPCTIDQTSVSSSSPASSIMDNEMLIPKSSDTRRARNVLARKTSMRAQRQRHSHSFGNTARSNLVKSTPWGRKTKTTSRPKTTTTTSTTTTSTAQTSSPLSSRSRKRMHRPQKRMTANNAPNQSNLDRTMSIEDVSSSSSSSTSSKAQSPFKRRQWGSTSFTQSQSLPSHRDHMENNSSSSSVINFATLNRNLESLDDSGEYLNSSASSSSSSSSKPADYVGTPKTHLSSTDVAGSSSSVPTSTFSRRFFHGRKPSSSSSRLANKRKISSLKSDDDDDSDDQQLWDTSQDTDNDIASLQKNPIAKRRLQPNVKRRLTEHLFRQAKNEEKATKQLATKIEAMTERSQIERKKAENRLQQASLLHNQIAQFTEFLNQLQQDNVDFDDLEPLSENPMDDEIGAGSFGTVYKRKYQGTVVAVKEIKHIHLTPEHVEDFQREVSTLSRVRHPNVVHLIGAGWTDKRDKLSLFLVMEYLPGGTLYDLVHSSMFRKTPDVEGLLTHIALQIAAGMENLHRQQNIIHRDLKASNVLLDSDYTPKIADFGLARLQNDRGKLTHVGCGRYMAPEITRGEPYTEKVDVYSYGMMLWEMFTGQVPFSDLEATPAAFKAATNNARPPIPEDELDEEIVELIQQCWHPKPDERPSFTEIISALQDMDRREPSARDLVFLEWAN
eukprot:TRINITY_DN752_c0_g1_i10.p1 TRINITY_DN752_c0_g1~~TRINITY_DN752_c0_g1_i10.p1  ORF type:complete len:703 (+),score=199.97 TRINITY_DN752_c0_g1_i10:2276-4384(+)